jgi:hypothetical protein
MLHKTRTWCLHSASDAFDLAAKLTESTWTLCTAFCVAEYVFANDATSPDGAQEYAVLRPRDERGDYQQIESITFSWCSEKQAFDLILRILHHEFDQQLLGSVSLVQLQDPHDHMVCEHCA